MGAELTTCLEQDAFQSVNGVLCENQLTSTESASTQKSFRRTSADISQRQQIFGFCAQWDLTHVTDFLRWYTYYEKKRCVKGDFWAGITDLTHLHHQVDELIREIEAFATLQEQLEEETRIANKMLRLNASDTEEDEQASSSISASNALLVVEDLQARQRDMNQVREKKEQLLYELKMHLLASIEGIALMCEVKWSCYIKAATQVRFQTKMNTVVQASSQWHPASFGFVMRRDSEAGALLSEYRKGDILLPPPENHEIDGHTDDSASSSGASDDESDAIGDNEDEGDGLAANAEREGAIETEQGNDMDANAIMRKNVTQKARNGGDSDEGSSDGEEESDEEQHISMHSIDGEPANAAEGFRSTNKSSPKSPNRTILDEDSQKLAQVQAETEGHSKDATSAYGETLKRPRITKRKVPILFDALSRNPVFFGYTLDKHQDPVEEVVAEQQSMEEKENAIFQFKIDSQKAKLEATQLAERGKLQAITQKEADLKTKREKYWQKRNTDLERAKKELDPNDIFFRTHEAQDRRVRDQESLENDELSRQKHNILMRIQSAQEEFEVTITKISQIRSTEIPLGEMRLTFHQMELDRYQEEINDKKRALITAQEEYMALKSTKSVAMAGQVSKHRAQMLFAEGQIKSRENELEAACLLQENELFLFTRAKEIFEQEKIFLPLYTCLQKGGLNSPHQSNFTLLEITIALLFGIGTSPLSAKIRFLFDMFVHKGRDHSNATVAADVIPVLHHDSFTEILSQVFRLLSKIGDMHPVREFTREYIQGIADREFLTLQIGVSQNTALQTANGMTRFEFEKYCFEAIEKSKYLCELLDHPWKYNQLSRYVIQHMSATHQYKLGLININDLKYAISRQLTQSREELSRWKKMTIHERALAMGENDPLKTDYSKYLPKRRTKLLSNVVPLDHGGYRNLLHYRMEVIIRATIKLQTIWRAKKGRQLARLAAEKQAFYHARGVALEEARVAVENEWKEKDAKPAHSVEKMKFEAKLRMKQVKLRTKGNAFTREQIFALLMEEAVQLAQKEVENRFREMEEELGYLGHAESLQLSYTEMGYLQDNISKKIVAQVIHAKEEPPQVSSMRQIVAANDEKSRKQKTNKTINKQDFDRDRLLNEAPQTEEMEESEQHFMHEEDIANRQLRMSARKKSMIFGRLPQDLHSCGLTKDEQIFEMTLCFSDPSLRELHTRLQQICVGMTELKMTEFLQELPSKRHICDYTCVFRRFDGSYDMEAMEKDLFEHFRMVRGADQLAAGLVNIAETDLDFGMTRKLLGIIEDENFRVLGKLVVSDCSDIAEKNAAIEAKKIVRMGYKISTGIDHTQADDSEDNQQQVDPAALLIKKEQHSRREREKRVQEAYARLLEAMKAWKDAELSLLDTEKNQLRPSTRYPILPMHHTKWTERFQHALTLPEEGVQHIQEKYTEILHVCHDFIATATSIAVVLVREYYLPLRDKSILPTTESAIDGRKDHIRTTTRLKYEVHDILFKICTDDHGRFEGSHEFAAKFGGHEVRNSALYLRTLSHVDNLLMPLQCCVDFQGFRVLCSAKIPVEIISWSESGTIQKTSKQLVYGSDNRGESIVFQSKELDNILAEAAARLNLSRHGVRGYQDLTSKTVHAAADMLGYINNQKRLVLLNFARAMPPEDPDVTSHLTQSTRGMSILWRQLRPELVGNFSTPLSPDALSSMTYCTPDWQAQALGVEDATKYLIYKAIPLFAKKLSQKENYFYSKGFDITTEMHRHGINMRHLGLLRSQFPFALAGTATLQYATGEIQTTEDFTREVERGSLLYIAGKACTVSSDPTQRFDASCITLTTTHMGDSIQNVTVYCGNWECKQHASAIRSFLLAEMVARTFKNLVRHFMRMEAKANGSGITSAMFNQIVIQSLNLLTGRRPGSETFWKTHVYEGVRCRFGLRAVSEVDKQNLRRNLLSRIHYIVTRTVDMMGFSLSSLCLEHLKQHPDCYTFVLDDLVDSRDQYQVKHNMSMLHFSIASLLLLQATIKQATSYKQLIMADGPDGYWPLCERRGSLTAANLGKLSSQFVGKYLPGCVLESDGPIVNADINRSIQLNKEARSYVRFPYVQALYPADENTHVSLEAWCKCDGHESTRRVIMTLGRFTLTALKVNMWAISINIKNIDIYAYGAKVELGKWTHLVGTYDGTILRLYVDGFLQSEVESENVVNLELQKREAVINKTREDIADLENEAKGKCYKEVEKECQQFFVSKEGRKQIKHASQQLLDEHEFRVQLSKNAVNDASSPAVDMTPSSPENGRISVVHTKNSSKVSRSDFEPLAKKQILRAKFDEKWLAAVENFKEMRHRLNLKITKELEEQSQQDTRQLRIGCLSSVRRNDGKYFFHGNIAHVAYYKGQALSRDQINAHYVMAIRDRAHESDHLFSLASSRFSRGLAFAPDDKKVLEKFAENICASLKYDLGHKHAQEVYKKKVICGLQPFLMSENAHGIAEILKNLPREPIFSDLFVYCYSCLMKIQPNYFQATESSSCRLGLQELGSMPFKFFLGSKSAYSLVNIMSGYDHSDDEEVIVSVFADIICKVLLEYPTYYGDQLTNMAWLRQLRNPKAVVYFILAMEAGEDARHIDLKDVDDISDEDMDIITKNCRFCCRFKLAKCSKLSDLAIQRMSVSCTQIEVLDISHCTSVTDTALISIGKHCNRLLRLWMTHCPQISDVGVEAVVCTNPKIEELGLSCCERISDWCFSTIGKSCLKLTVLELELCMQVGNAAMKYLANIATLRKLNVAGCRRIGDEGIEAIARRCVRLQELNVRMCDKLSDLSLRVLTHNCLELEHLYMEEVCYASYKIFVFDQEGDGRGVVEKNMIKKMKSVNLAGCAGLSDLTLGYLGHRARMVESINISACTGITDQGLSWLLDDMLDHTVCGACIQQLDLSYCPELTAQGIHRLVLGCSKLTSLNISGCVHLKDKDLIDIIESCANLVRLQVAFCRELTDSVLVVIAKHLALEELDVSRCVKITDDGMLEVASQSTVLRKLNVSACKKLTERTLNSLLDECRLLEEIDVTHCPQFPPKLLARFVKRKVKIMSRKLEELSINTAVATLEGAEKMQVVGDRDPREEIDDTEQKQSASNTSKPIKGTKSTANGKARKSFQLKSSSNNLPSIHKREDI